MNNKNMNIKNYNIKNIKTYNDSVYKKLSPSTETKYEAKRWGEGIP